MGRPRLDSLPGQDPHIIKRRPLTDGTIYGHSTGGVESHQIVTMPQRQDFTQMNRVPTSYNDTLIERDRTYLYRRPSYYYPGDGGGNHNWTADGPAKDLPTTRFNRNIRPLVGGGHRDMWGQHTNIVMVKNGLTGKPRMRPGQQNRLTVQRYRGQSYSATTKLVGQ